MSDEEANNSTTCECGGSGIHKHKPLWKRIFNIKHDYKK